MKFGEAGSTHFPGLPGSESVESISEGGEEFGRWIPLPIPGMRQFQPSEIAKIGLVAFYAWGCEKYHSQIVSKDKKVAVKTAIIFGSIGVLFTLLVFLEHHLSGAILFAMLTIAMLYLGGFNKWWFVAFISIIAVFVFSHKMKQDK